MYETEDTVVDVDEFVDSAPYPLEDQNALSIVPRRPPASPTNVNDIESSMITADDCSVFEIAIKCKPKKKFCKSKKKMSNKIQRNRSARSPCKGSVKRMKKKKRKKCTKKKATYICQKCKYLDTEVNIDSTIREPSTPCPSRLKSTQTSSHLRKQTELKYLDLLFDVFKSVDSLKADVDFNRIYNEGEESGLPSDTQHKCELNKKLQELYELWKRSDQISRQPCPQTCVATCPPMCGPVFPPSPCCPRLPPCMRMCQPACAPCSPWQSIIQKFCNPCCRGCEPARQPCSPSRCVPCCTFRSPEGEATKKTKDEDLQFKSRMWLLEMNDKLEKKLSKLKAREEKECCCCCCPPPCGDQYSFSLWQMIAQSLVKSLVESHPAVKKDNGVCRCRLQNLKLQ